MMFKMLLHHIPHCAVFVLMKEEHPGSVECQQAHPDHYYWDHSIASIDSNHRKHQHTRTNHSCDQSKDPPYITDLDHEYKFKYEVIRKDSPYFASIDSICFSHCLR